MARIDVRNWSARACARCDISHILRHFVLYRFRLSRKLPRPARPPPTDAPYPLVVFRCRREAHFIFNFFSPQHSKVSVSDEDDGSGGTCIAVLYCLRPPAPALGCLLSVRRTTLFVRGSGGGNSSLLIARIHPWPAWIAISVEFISLTLCQPSSHLYNLTPPQLDPSFVYIGFQFLPSASRVVPASKSAAAAATVAVGNNDRGRKKENQQQRRRSVDAVVLRCPLFVRVAVGRQRAVPNNNSNLSK